MEIQNFNFAEIFIFLSSLCVIFGHNLWLIGKNETPEKTKIKINTGDDFPFSDSAVKTERIAEFKVLSENGAQNISDFAVEGNSLTAFVEEKPRTAFVAAIELSPHPITLEAGKFAYYIKNEDAEIFTAPDFIIGETLEKQRESYAKFAKVLVKNNAENTEIFSRKIGHKFEIVIMEVSAKYLRVEILLEDNPVKNLRVSSGAEDLNGGRYAAHTRTDKNGFAEVEITQKGLGFVRSHLIRRHSDAEDFEWESFWASAVFYV